MKFMLRAVSVLAWITLVGLSFWQQQQIARDRKELLRWAFTTRYERVSFEPCVTTRPKKIKPARAEDSVEVDPDGHMTAPSVKIAGKEKFNGLQRN